MPGKVAKGNYPALIALLFPLVGAGLAFWAVRAWLQVRRFKSATLILARVPIALGGQLQGAIRVDANVPVTKEFRIDLSCIERVARRTGKGSETSERIVWQNQWTIGRERCELMESYSSIPLDLPIPANAPAASIVEDDDRIEWRLDASADCPGPDFWMRFEVPVFDAGERAGTPTLDEALASRAAGDEPRGASAVDEATEQPDAGRLAELGIVYELLPQGGEPWTFKRAQHKGVAAMLTLITAIIGASAVFLFLADAPVILALAFAGFDATFIWWALHPGSPSTE